MHRAKPEQFRRVLTQRRKGPEMQRIMLRMGPLLNLFPSAPRSRMLQIPLLAAAKLVELRVRDRRLRVLLGDAVPEVFDKLKTFSASEFEERCKCSVHGREIADVSP